MDKDKLKNLVQSYSRHITEGDVREFSVRCEAYDNEKEAIEKMWRMYLVPQRISPPYSSKDLPRLSDVLDNVFESKFDIKLIHDIIYSVVKVVHKFHRLGAIHGDLNLNNIVYDVEAKRFFLIDFETSYFLDNGPYVTLDFEPIESEEEGREMPNQSDEIKSLINMIKITFEDEKLEKLNFTWDDVMKSFNPIFFQF